MTKTQALEECERRWKRFGKPWVEVRTCEPYEHRGRKYVSCGGAHGPDCKGGKRYFTVGYLGGYGDFRFFSVQGQGRTWAEAFAKAERTFDSELARCKQR